MGIAVGIEEGIAVGSMWALRRGIGAAEMRIVVALRWALRRRALRREASFQLVRLFSRDV